MRLPSLSLPQKILASFLLAFVALLGFQIARTLAGSAEAPTATWNVTPQLKNFPGDRPTACAGGGYEFFNQFNGVGENDGTYSTQFIVDGITVTVEITVNSDNTIDFDITNGVATQVWFKSAEYMLYQYDPPVSGATNSGPVSYDTGLHDGVNQNGTYNGLSHLDACITPVYPLTARKTASASYDERHTWSIDKSVVPETSSGFAGDTLPWTWKVDVSETSANENIAVTGNITVFNQNAFAVPVTVTDQLNDGTVATVNCPAASVPANSNLVCSYTASPTGVTASLNTATVTSGNPAVAGTTANAGVTFVKTVINGTATVTDDEIGLDESLTAGQGSWQYLLGDGHTCSSDQAAYGETGSYGDSEYNLATVTASNGQTDSDDATTRYTCYAPVMDKDVATSTYTEEYLWDIIKGEDAVYYKFIGESVVHSYDIELIQSGSSLSGFTVEGTIDVTNPVGSPGDMTVDVADLLDDGTVGAVDCGGGSTTVVVAPGTTESCNYIAFPNDASADLNTATGTFNGIDFTATANVIWQASPQDAEVNITDDYGTPGDDTDDKAFGAFSTSANPAAQYDRDFVCPGDVEAYTGGVYTETVVNTATIDETGDSDDATVTLNCYIPTVDKDGSGTYDETHTWDIEKSVDPTSQSGYPGDELDWTWTVTLSETSEDSNFQASGNIYVTNPNPVSSMVVQVTDALSNGNTIGVFSSANCQVAVVDSAAVLTVPANSTATCAWLSGSMTTIANSNEVSIRLNSVDFIDIAELEYTANVINGTANVDDDQEPGLPATVSAGEGPWEWTETQSHTCSSDYSDYGGDGSYSDTRYNTATVTASNGQSDEAPAETTYTCEAFTVELLKTTNGIEDPERVWTFKLYEGPNGFGTTAIATDTTPPALLDFGGVALRPDSTYTVCEVDVLAGWTSFWQLNGSTVIPYNPNADDDPSEDLGNRCVDFGASTEEPVAAGTVFSFAVDNSHPGGDPRTPGYWKNWNRCTGGGQANNADRNGGYAEGFWLLENVLDPTVGGGIVWDDILSDSFVFPISTCEVAVDILDKRVVGDAGVVGDGAKVASDPLHNLATHLLAAQLNFGAGACTTQDVLDAALAAETLLDKYNFNGNTHGLSSKGKNANKADASLANSLAGYLDDYNNGEFCGSLV